MCASQELLLSLLKGVSVVFMCILLSPPPPQSYSSLEVKVKDKRKKCFKYSQTFEAVKTIPEISLRGDTAIAACSVSVDGFPKRNSAQWRLTLSRNGELWFHWAITRALSNPHYWINAFTSFSHLWVCYNSTLSVAQRGRLYRWF